MPSAPVRDVAPCAAEERRRRIDERRQRQHEARPLEQALLFRRDAFGRKIGGDGEHHHLHHREQRHRHAQQQRAPFGAGKRLAARGVVGMRAIADRGHGAQHRRQPRLARIPGDGRAPVGEIDARLDDARLPREPCFDQPDAGAAGQAFEQQRGFATPRAVVAHEAGRRGGFVPLRPVVGGFGSGSNRVFGAARIETGEPRGVDGLRDRQATRAAKVSRRAVRPRRATRDWPDWACRNGNKELASAWRAGVHLAARGGKRWRRRLRDIRRLYGRGDARVKAKIRPN